MAWAWIKYLREKTLCDCEHTPMAGRRSGMFTLLFATVFVLGFAGLNLSRYVSASPSAAKQEQPAPAGLSRVTIPVAGMTCVTCEFAVNTALRKTQGVKSAEAHVASNSATIEYDPAKTNPAKLVEAINATGYRATLPQK